MKLENRTSQWGTQHLVVLGYVVIRKARPENLCADGKARGFLRFCPSTSHSNLSVGIYDHLAAKHKVCLSKAEHSALYSFSLPTLPAP